VVEERAILFLNPGEGIKQPAVASHEKGGCMPPFLL
jgi:hypothetical protein